MPCRTHRLDFPDHRQHVRRDGIRCRLVHRHALLPEPWPNCTVAQGRALGHFRGQRVFIRRVTRGPRLVGKSGRGSPTSFKRGDKLVAKTFGLCS